MVMLFLVGCSTTPTELTSTSEPTISPSNLVRAMEGEEVLVLINRVKADHWKQHQDFVLTVLVPAAEEFASVEMAHTRMLFGTERNPDDTYTSVFLMDPFVPDGNYSILDILIQAHGEAQGKEYFQVWEDSLAEDQEGYTVRQSPW